MEVWQLRQEEMEAPKDANPVRLPYWSAVGADNFHEVLEAFATGDHVHNVTPNLDNELLGEHYPGPHSRAEGVAAEVVVTVETDAGDALMELRHLPHGVQGHAP